jgi:hypothetical protein
VSSRPDWYTDPTGRHDLRYFNGTSWTGDVSDSGRRSVDPLGPHPRRRGTRSVVATLLALAGFGTLVIAVVVVPRAAAYLDVSPHTVEIVDCAPTGSEVALTVALTNAGESSANYTIHVRILDDNGAVIRDTTLEIDAVAAGSTIETSDRLPARFETVVCEIRGVSGPLPFGIDLGPAPSSG